MRPLSRPSILTALLVFLGAAAAAQDRRTVVEPRFPPACAVLEARLDAPRRRLSEADERRSDTERLQEAIDRCPSGRAVKLTRAGERTVFLSGPLRLKPRHSPNFHVVAEQTDDPQLPQGSQAVALKVTGDRAVFRNVRVLGNQDTLYVGSTNCEGPNGRPCTPARAYFERCHVEGNVDFVFGDGKAFFEGCTI